MIVCGDALVELRKLPDESVNCCVTSPPYWGLRDYGVAGQLGLEKTPEEYVARMVEVFREVRRVLRSDGTCWLNLGDSYANDGKWGGTTGGKHAAGLHGEPVGRRRRDTGLKPKDLVGVPWRVAFALQADGWWLRQDIIWAKPNPMPESVTDRCTKAHEYIFMFAKNGKTILWRAKDTLEWSYKPDLSEILGHNEKGKPINRWVGFSYWYDAEAVKEGRTTEHEGHQFGGNKYNQANIRIKHSPGSHYKSDGSRNPRSVWSVTTKPMPKVFGQEHFATFPPEIPERCIKAGCPKGGTVLDPFFGAGTTGLVALRLGRDFLGIDLSPAYCEIARKRIYGTLGAEIADANF